MNRVHAAFLLAACLVPAAPVLSASAHGPAGDQPITHDGHPGDAMRAQHERMADFKEAMELIFGAIVRSDTKAAAGGAEKLAGAIKGHERDVPHRNRARSREFHGLFVQLEKRTERLRASLRANDLPKAGASYGKVLETCAACHRQFRD